jgi:LysR family transcriptional activator of glutamate synthase operon
MDVDALRWFQQVADGVTVTEVSELAMVSQSGVSRALARLEAEVGTPLLRRSGRTLRMTHAGAVFKPYVDRCLHTLDDGIAEIEQLIDPEAGTVALAFQQSFGTWLVPDLIRSFRAEHPKIQFALSQVRDDVLTSVLEDGQTDLELGTRRPRDSGLQSRVLSSEPLRLAIPREHRLRRRRTLSLTDVAAEPFIGLPPTSALRRSTDELCARAGFTAVVVFEGDDLSTVRGMVAAGLGVAVVPAPRSGTPESAVGPVRYCEILDPGASREIRLAWVGQRPLPPAARLFREHVLARTRAGRIPAVSDGLQGPAGHGRARSSVGSRGPISGR